MSNHPKDPDYFKIKRGRKRFEHRESATEGYLPKNPKYVDSRYAQVHHQLPVSCLQDSHIRDVVKKEDDFWIVRKCLMFTKWNVNDEANCIGLPIRRAFVQRAAPKKDLWGLPCHEYGHNPYTDKVKKKLKVWVWDKALEQAKECGVNYQDIKKELDESSSKWRSFLTTRGQMYGGTEICWKERRYRPNWWIPFSMAPGKPPEVNPPPTMDEFKADMKEAIKRLFKKLGT